MVRGGGGGGEAGGGVYWIVLYFIKIRVLQLIIDGNICLEIL